MSDRHHLKGILLKDDFRKVMSLVRLGSLVGSVGRESACTARDLGSIPGWGRSPGEGNGYPLQCSCLENPMDRRAWWATYRPGGHKESDITEQAILSLAFQTKHVVSQDAL